MSNIVFEMDHQRVVGQKVTNILMPDPIALDEKTGKPKSKWDIFVDKIVHFKYVIS